MCDAGLHLFAFDGIKKVFTASFCCIDWLAKKGLIFFIIWLFISISASQTVIVMKNISIKMELDFECNINKICLVCCISKQLLTIIRIKGYAPCFLFCYNPLWECLK